MRPRQEKEKCRRRLQRRKFFSQAPRGRVQHLLQERSGRLGSQMHAIHIGVFRMGILLVSWSRIMRGFEQKFPGTPLVEHASCRSFLVRDYDQRALSAATDFERNSRYRGSVERPRGIIVREWCKKTGDFILVGSESIPPVTITVIDHRAGAENLPHTRDVLS